MKKKQLKKRLDASREEVIDLHGVIRRLQWSVATRDSRIRRQEQQMEIVKEFFGAETIERMISDRQDTRLREIRGEGGVWDIDGTGRWNAMPQ